LPCEKQDPPNNNVYLPVYNSGHWNTTAAMKTIAAAMAAFATGMAFGAYLSKESSPPTTSTTTSTDATTTETLITSWTNKFEGKSPAPGKNRNATTQVPTFISKVGQKRYRIAMEPGRSSGKHISPMQSLLASAASSLSASLLHKLQQLHYTIDNLALSTSATITDHILTSITFHVDVTSPNLGQLELQSIIQHHSCMVVENLKIPSSSIVTTAVVKELVEI